MKDLLPAIRKKSMRENRFENKVAIITGAAQGIGRDVAVAMAKEGANLVVVDRSPIIGELSETLKNQGCKVIEVIADLEKSNECQRVIDVAKLNFNRVDILINNVGGTIWVKPFEHYTTDEVVAEINRSLFPTLWCTHAVLPMMIEQGGGSIVNVSSICTRGIYRVPYSAAKGGVNAITTCLAFENGRRGVRVNGVAPGGVDAGPRRIPRNSNALNEQEKQWYQEMVDQSINATFMNRYGDLSDQTNAILFLASDESKYITGVTIPVAGGDIG